MIALFLFCYNLVYFNDLIIAVIGDALAAIIANLLGVKVATVAFTTLVAHLFLIQNTKISVQLHFGYPSVTLRAARSTAIFALS